MLKKRIAVLVSGGGTNLQALLDAERGGVLTAGQIVLVITDRPAAAFGRAAAHGVTARGVFRKECAGQADFEAKMLKILQQERIDLIVLAGFLSILSSDFVRHYQNRIINIHPSLIPAFCGAGFYGLRVHEAALARGVKLSGATVHFVNEIPDGGAIIAQQAVEVLENDTPQTLQQRIMEQAEWQILPRAVQQVCLKMGGDDTLQSISAYLKPNPYPGRGIFIGLSPDGNQAVLAYFIMGRSENSRNRVFICGQTEEELEQLRLDPVKFNDPELQSRMFGLRTQAHDPAKLSDPSLVIYTALRNHENQVIVTNGDQTDTIYHALAAGGNFEEALRSREYEPDAPNFTPRISGLVTLAEDGISYKLSILKKGGEGCQRFFYEYAPQPGAGHIIHTYAGDGSPLPSFNGEPVLLPTRDDIGAFTNELWNALDVDNRVALHVRYINLSNQAMQTYTRDRFEGSQATSFFPVG